MNTASRPIRPAVTPYIVAILAVALATEARMALQPALQDNSPFFTYFVAMMGVTWFYGFLPGLLVTAMGGWLGSFLFAIPGAVPHNLEASLTLSTITFFVMGTFSSAVCEAMRRASAKAVKSEQRFRSLINASVSIVWNSTQDGRFIEPQTSWEAYTGQGWEKHRGHGWLDVLHPDDRGIAQANWLAAGDGKIIAEAEGRLWNADRNEYRFVFVRAVPVMDSEGNLVEYLGTVTDVHERRLAEDALRANRERLQAILDNSPAAIYLKDLQRRFILVNKRLEEQYDAPASEILGKRTEEIRPGLEVRPLIEADRKVVETGHPFSADVKEEIQGAEKRYQILKFPIVDESGHVYAIGGISTDITETKRLESALFQAQKMESVGRLAGGVAHDFNNLLTAVVGFAELAALRLKPGDPVTYYVEQIQKAGERASKVTSQLLAFARKQLFEPRVLDLNELVEHLSDLLLRLAGPDVSIQFVPGTTLWNVRADPGLLEQVIVNLMVNARDAMPVGGTFLLETKNVVRDRPIGEGEDSLPAGDYVLVSASDTGIGMVEEVRRHIFEPFYTTKPTGKGTGLGLSTAYGIAKQSGGNIFVLSEPGKGTTFEIYLPRVREEADAFEPNSSSKLLPRGEATVLVVEDEDVVRSLAIDTLAELGYRTLEAYNGVGAMQIVEGHTGPIDLLVTDVVMPAMSGQELARNALKVRPEMRVLFISGYTDGALNAQGQLEPDMDLLQKPFAPAQLAQRVQEALNGKA